LARYFQKGPKRGLTHQQFCPFNFPYSNSFDYLEFSDLQFNKRGRIFFSAAKFKATLPGAPVASRESSINFPENLKGK
jgi:hypothetical protein